MGPHKVYIYVTSCYFLLNVNIINKISKTKKLLDTKLKHKAIHFYLAADRGAQREQVCERQKVGAFPKNGWT